MRLAPYSTTDDNTNIFKIRFIKVCSGSGWIICKPPGEYHADGECVAME